MFFFFHIYFKHHQHSPQSACSSHSFTQSICIANHNHANEQIYSHRTVMKHTHMRYSWPMTTVDSRSLALWIHTHLNRMDLVWHRRIAKHTYAQTRKKFYHNRTTLILIFWMLIPLHISAIVFRRFSLNLSLIHAHLHFSKIDNVISIWQKKKQTQTQTCITTNKNWIKTQNSKTFLALNIIYH